MTALSEAADKLHRVTIGAIKQREKDHISIRHRKKISVFFHRQKGMVMEVMKSQAYLFSESFQKMAEESPVDFTSQNWDRIWEVISNNTNPELQEILAAAQADSLIAGAQQLKKLFNTDTTFNLANPRAVAWFQQHGGSVDLIRGIQQTTGDQIKGIITNAINNGWNYGQTAKEISGKFDGFSRERAKTIAIHETAQAYEEGNMLFSQSLKDDGIQMEKHWDVSPDELVCDICLENEADGWIDIDKPHTSGDQQPPAHVNDRCYETYREAP